MRRTKQVADLLRFCPENNHHYGDYDTDWGDYTKTICPRAGLQVNEGGVISLHTTTDRNLDQRQDLNKMFGIDVRITSELPPLFTPAHLGAKKIPKNAMRQSFFLIDHETCGGRCLALNTDYRSRGITPYAKWMNPVSPASTDHKVMTRERNFAREKEWMKEHAEVILKAEALYALEDCLGMTNQASSWQAQCESAMRGKASWDSSALLSVARLRKDYASMDGWTEALITVTADYREYDYLTLHQGDH